MTASNVSRRNFLVGCSTAIAAMAGARLQYVAFGSPEQGTDQEILITIFCRGGYDGLNIVAPVNGPDREHYESGRPSLKLPVSGEGALLSLGTMSGGSGEFGLHPAAAPLHELFQDNRLALVHAAGLHNDTRSHFDAMDLIERGTSNGDPGLSNGWLTRHLQSAPDLPEGIIMPAVAVGNLQPISLLGSREAIAMNRPTDFSFYGHWQHTGDQRRAMRKMYAGEGWLHEAGIRTLDAVDIIESYTEEYTPANGAVYPAGGFGEQLKVLAQVIKWQLGLHVATVDLGGWDTHESQGNGSGGYFANLLAQLAQGLHAFYTDLNGAGDQDFTKQLTIVVMSEFGRRLKMKASGGTDHGHGNLMMLLGGNVTGGLKGSWPGLATEQLYDRADLQITTDYRRVLSEVLIRRLANPNLGVVFPNYTGYEPLGIVQGTDLEPVYGNSSEHTLRLPAVMR